MAGVAGFEPTAFGFGDRRSTTELHSYKVDVVGLARLELATSRLSGVRSNHLSYRPLFLWSRWRDSNPRPHGPKPRALPNCATPRLAEKEGFEPSHPLPRSTPLAGEPLQPLEYFSIGGEGGIRTHGPLLSH